MGFGFLYSGAVKGKIKERLRKDGNGSFTDDELNLAADKFESAGDGKDLDALKDESRQRDKAIEIFKRIRPENASETSLVEKIKVTYGLA